MSFEIMMVVGLKLMHFFFKSISPNNNIILFFFFFEKEKTNNEILKYATFPQVTTSQKVNSFLFLKQYFSFQKLTASPCSLKL